jgi:3-hydroxyacyl-[acyl-carrier protein] dehydratase/trans-2-decenoyl-[acyl-carrier protein] isomerase
VCDRARIASLDYRPSVTKGLVVFPNPHDFHTPQPSYSKKDLLKSSEGGYFGLGNAQLPAPPMLMMDRITEISLDGGEFGKGHIVAELDITTSLWFFDCTFPGDPVMPGSLGLDALWQMIGYWLGWSGPRAKAGPWVSAGDIDGSHHTGSEMHAPCSRYAPGAAWQAGSWNRERTRVRR